MNLFGETGLDPYGDREEVVFKNPFGVTGLDLNGDREEKVFTNLFRETGLISFEYDLVGDFMTFLDFEVGF
jgi:hypothetical protein